MIQAYFLSVFLLILSSLMYYQGQYRTELAFMLRFMDELERNRRFLNLFFLTGCLTSLLLLFFPSYPGPMILGDLIPSLVVLYNTLYFYITIRRREKDGRTEYLDASRAGRRIVLARISLLTALLHFLLPSFVLI